MLKAVVAVVAPVPPYAMAIVLAAQTPVEMVPSVVMLVWPTYPLDMLTTTLPVVGETVI